MDFVCCVWRFQIDAIHSWNMMTKYINTDSVSDGIETLFLTENKQNMDKYICFVVYTCMKSNDVVCVVFHRWLCILQCGAISHSIFVTSPLWTKKKKKSKIYIYTTYCCAVHLYLCFFRLVFSSRFFSYIIFHSFTVHGETFFHLFGSVD